MHDVVRSLTKGGDFRFRADKVTFPEGGKRRQTFGFIVSGNGILLWRGSAAANLHRRAIERGIEVELKNQWGFAATLSPADGAGDPWILELTENGAPPSREP